MLRLTAIVLAVNTAIASPALAMSAPTEKPLVDDVLECHTAVGAGLFHYRIIDRIEFDEEGFGVTWNDRAVGLHVSQEVTEMQEIILNCFQLFENQGDPMKWPTDEEE